MMKKLLKRLSLGMLLLLVVSYCLLQTAPIKTLLTNIIAKQLSTPLQQVEITRLRGHIPWQMSIKQFRLKSGADDALIIDDIALDWRLLRLARGELVINSLKVRDVQWLKPLAKTLAKTPKTKQSKPFQTFPNLAIGEVLLPKIIIAKGLAGKEELQLQLMINGDKNQMMQFKGQLLVQKGINTELLFNFSPNSRSSFLLDIALNEAAGGLVGSLLKLPAKQSIKMQALLKGDLQSLGGGFNLRLGDELLADLSINSDYANHLQINGTGALPAFVQLPTFINNRNWQLNASLKRTPDFWQIEAWHSKLANIALDLTGEISSTKATLQPSFSTNIDKHKYQAAGDVALDFVAQSLQANLAGGLPNLPMMQVWLGNDAKLAWQAKADGELAKPKLNLEMQATKLNLNPKIAHLKLGKVAKIAAKLDGNKLQAELNAGELNLNMGATLKKRINANIELVHQTLPTINIDATLNGTKIEAMKLTTTGALMEAINLNFRKPSGKIALQADDISPLIAWLGIDQASGKITASADIAKQQAIFEATNLQLPQYDFSIAQLNTKLQDGAITSNMTGEHQGEKTSLEIVGNYAQNQAKLSTFKGEYAEHNFKLTAPTAIIWKNNDWELKPSVMEIAGATLNMQGKQANNMVDINITLPNLPLRPLLQNHIPTMGEANLKAQATITGKPNSPIMSFDAALIASEMTKIDKDNNAPQQLALKLQGKYAGQLLNATANLTSGAEQLGNGKIALPLEFSLQPFILKLRPNPMQANAHLEVAMSRFNSWLSPLGHRIKANLLADLSANGDALHPNTKAKILLKDFNYTNLASGICLRHGEMQAQLTPEGQFVLQTFNAKGDRDRGTINASGVADFAAKNANGAENINFKITAKDAAIFCSPMLDGAISGGLKMAGNQSNLKLTGALQLGKTSILIPSGGKTAIPKVEKIYRHELARKSSSKPQKSPIMLDLSINAPARVFVRGRGLDAEFGGNLHIIGNANAPKIEGKLASRRGRLALLGSTMQINEGIIRFMNGAMQKPYIQLQGSTKTNNTQITVDLEGAVLKPKLALSSNPSLPQDEILALLLFGKPLQKISPFQALQLAQAAASLASGESGTGMLGSAREVLGVDSLNVGEGADGSPTIGAGKYVTDKVFVGIEQGTTPESRRISTEIELSPTVTGKTSTNSQGEPTLGLEWRYDY